MTRGRGVEPTETTDDELTVIVLGEPNRRDRTVRLSFKEAIQTVRAEQPAATTTKIEDRNGEVVFTSVEMEIEDRENEWERAKYRLAVDVEEYDCPYDAVGCVADDLCVQCKMDKVQTQ
ncbi:MULTISPECIES: hypothetical protein [Haloarcula]|uniref:hypothetical protein n=1 Tax=Haloarcula TaxID=2237 RepID=UPI0023EC6CB2|nr:hypothetical protein [Halomicroarcula sp. XH51]